MKKTLLLCTWALASFSVFCSTLASADNVSTWPGSGTSSNADKKNAFGKNVSGLFYQPAANSKPAVVWAVKNAPSILYKLDWNGKNYVSDSNNGWSAGKSMSYPDGKGAPDAEGVTMAELSENAVYVVSERDGNQDSVNRFSILRYDLSGSGSTLRASHEWNFTAAMPTNTPVNKGPEAIAWVPDSYLTQAKFYDEHKKTLYQPQNYANHGSGLFFVGMEDTGTIYAFALNFADSSYTIVATINSGESAIMDLSFERDNQVLWAHCDDTCNNRNHLLTVDGKKNSASAGKFIVQKSLQRPSDLPDYNFEGIAIAPEAECKNGQKHFLWANDSNDDKHVIWQSNIQCGALF